MKLETWEMRVQSSEAISALGALAHEHRLALFRLLVRTGEEGLPAGEIAVHLRMPNSSLSFHLAQLTQVGLIRQQRRGRSILYSANYTAMNDLVGYLMENCCLGAGGCAPDPACDPLPAQRKKEPA